MTALAKMGNAQITVFQSANFCQQKTQSSEILVKNCPICKLGSVDEISNYEIISAILICKYFYIYWRIQYYAHQANMVNIVYY